MILYGLTTCVLLSVLSFVRTAVAQDVCTAITTCSCTGTNGTIDLSPLAKGGSKAAFMDQPDPSSSFFYSWNPCTDFTEGEKVTKACTGVAACQSDSSGNNYYDLGDQKSASFVVDPSKGLTLQYKAITDITRTTIVTLKCDPTVESNFVVEGEDPSATGTYLMTLTSKYACPGGGGGGSTPGSLSIGSILVIAVIGLCFLYLICGTVYMVFVRKARGVEMVPNISLWSQVFALTKDGFIFTFTCGRRSGYGKV